MCNHHVVHGLKCEIKVIALPAWPRAFDVHIGDNSPDLVEGKPVRHLGILGEAKARISFVGIKGMPVEKIPFTIERIGRVEVMERYVGLHTLCSACCKKTMVEVHTLSIGLFIISVREDA